MRRNLFFSLFLILGLGLSVSSCAPGVYAGASLGAPYPYYGPSYYGPGYYAPRRVIVAPAATAAGGTATAAGTVVVAGAAMAAAVTVAAAGVASRPGI